MTTQSEGSNVILSNVTEMSPSIASLAKAMSKAQASVKGATKDSSNPFYGSKYSDLESCWDACRIPLTENGLSVIQLPLESVQGQVRLMTIVTHDSGEFISSVSSTPYARKLKDGSIVEDAQGVGSAVTYLRRYALCALAAIAPTDDDGNAASGLLVDSKVTTFKPNVKTVKWEK